MSIAGIQSNRGDIYQTLVAFDWALTVLSDQAYEWLEIDSAKYAVDDVVIGKKDGYRIACQCKKNKSGFTPWSISALGDELDKAANFLTNNTDSEVRFYSRNNYGHLGNLKEHSTTQVSESSFLTSLSKKQLETNTSLQKRLTESKSTLSTYQFLQLTKYITSDDMERMVHLLKERLGNLVSNPKTAFEALWTSLDLLGARISGDGTGSSTQHRLTKDDLREILSINGSVETPPVDLNEVRKSFNSTSAIGRSWKRDIAGHQIVNETLDQLLGAIRSKKRSILLTGKPGSGKTCVLLGLQEQLESLQWLNQGIISLFIQTREFADLETTKERHEHGLTEKWVEKAARLAEGHQVIVIMDSLDVLSIAREHSVLTYFLAQIDRLLLIPNITVVTACRDFDRHYDRRIAERKWDLEVQCKPLDWKNEISPLLGLLGIPTESIDVITRELISNPRELELFVELAKIEGSFNVVTSQALAQRYLDVVVRSNPSLGEEGLNAIEKIAKELLKTRSLVVPRQRITAKQEIVHELCSLNVLKETQEKKLTFGHQTLLDVLVISAAVKDGVSLSAFINSLPPVPFVRPSIRSFVAELALSDRREFRKQIRAVLTGNFAFHIRRLVAESFAEQLPDDSDWSLIRDLRNNHRAVFQVIYGKGLAAEWHYFWLRNLVPELLTLQDSDGLSTHVHRIAQWRNDDSKGVILFWNQALSLGWLEQETISNRIEISLSEVDAEGLKFATPLLKRLLEVPNQEHRFLGRAIAKCITAGVADDDLLWAYVTDDITPEALLNYRLEDKLNCQPHEFGDKSENFFWQRMQQSERLLDLAVRAIEEWSDAQHSRYPRTRIGYRTGFLNESSYANVHSKSDLRHIDSITILLNAVEASIMNHARTNSAWWKTNRNRLCFNLEGSLLYFAIQACSSFPETNLDLISSMLCDKNMLESNLNFELGNLTESAFPLLDHDLQDKIMATFQTVWDSEDTVDPSNTNALRIGVLRNRANLFAAIPRCLRSAEGQEIIDVCESRMGVLTRHPDIHSWEGWVPPPFTFEIFNNLSDSEVTRLLRHYYGIDEIHEFGSLIGGSRSVGVQLQDAASREPERFMSFLSAQWARLSEEFREDIMDGIANYLAYRYGNLQSNATWQPIAETDAVALAHSILTELESHSLFWSLSRAGSKAIEACASVIEDSQTADRIIFLIIGYINRIEPDPKSQDKVDLISQGINMVKGDVTEALMILASKFQEKSDDFPQLLAPTLRRYAQDEHPAIRALILRRLPYMQTKNFELGWNIFEIVMQHPGELWEIAEPCLYYSYYNNFEKVQPWLRRLSSDGKGKSLETFGRISALATLRKHISFNEFLPELIKLSSTDAWHGAATVWTHPENVRQHGEECLKGLEIGLNIGGECSLIVAKQMDHIYRDKSSALKVPVELIKLSFEIFEGDTSRKHNDLYGFSEWLNVISQRDPSYALLTTEIYLNYVTKNKPYIYDIEDSFPQLMTRLFAEAEDLEESDNGDMLKRVVIIQDKLLSLGVNGVEDWLKAAERR